MKYEVMLRSRAIADRPYETKHERFFRRLQRLPPPWGIDRNDTPPAPNCDGHIATGISFGKLLGKGIRGQVDYQYRRDYPEDSSKYDDFVSLTFDPYRVDYRQFVLETLPVYIETFDGYLAHIKDDAFFDDDFAKMRELRIDDRRSIYRVYPVSFYDETLCKSAFGHSAKQIADRLIGRIEGVRLIHNGVYLIGSSSVLDFVAANSLSKDMKRWIIGL